MKALRILTPIVLVALTWGVASYVQRRRWEEHTSDALTSRLRALQPAIERVLEHAFDAPIHVQAVPAGELRNTLTSEQDLAKLDTDEAARIRTCEALVDRHFRELGTIEEVNGTIILDPRPMQAAGLDSDAELAALLVHDAAHLYQFQVLGARGFLDTDQPGTVRLERLAALEAHAEWVARRVGAELGWEDAARRCTGWHRRREAEIGSAAAGPTAAIYTAALEHFQALVETQGLAAATRTLFEAEPR